MPDVPYQAIIFRLKECKDYNENSYPSLSKA